MEDMDIGASVVIDFIPEITDEEELSTPEAQTAEEVINEMLNKVSGESALERAERLINLDEDNSLSPLKKRKDSNENMDTDEIISWDDKENISKQIKRMTRQNLEDLVLLKVVEALVKHSSAGKLRTKVLELTMQKDRMFQKVGMLQNKIQELSRALKVVLDNQSRDPNSLANKKRPPPVKFYRSVGLQVSIEPSFRNGPSKVIHVNNNESPTNGFKTINGGVYNIPTNIQSQNKRGPRTVANQMALHRLTNGQTSMTKGSTSILVTNGHQSQGQQQQTIMKKNSTTSPSAVTVATSPSKILTPTVVDLTDDPSGSSQTTSSVLTSNGVQYRLVNSPSQAVQFIQSSQGSYQLVTSASGQVRPIILAQNLSTAVAGQQQQRPVQTMLLRNVAPKPSGSTATLQPRPSVAYTRPSSTVAVVSAGGQKPSPAVGTMTRAPQAVVLRKLQLPSLPAVGMTSSSSPQGGQGLKELPPRPGLTLNEQSDGIVLSWTMKLTSQNAEIASYQIYACQEQLTTSPGKVSQWKKVGDVKALPLPMACTLSQFTQGNRYFFIVRALDSHGRTGPFCEPGQIVLQRK